MRPCKTAADDSRILVCAFFASWFFVYGLSSTARAQDSYEIQVYAYDTVAPRSTMVEIHSNFTAEGSKTVQGGVLPSNHAKHETLEITQGINDWAELGFYLFSSIQPAGGWQWLGDRIRPRSSARLLALAGGREFVE